MRAYEIAEIDEEELEEGLKKARFFNFITGSEKRKLLAHGIGTVHSIAQKLHDYDVHGGISLYIGRAGESHVISRMKASRRTRGHRFGLVFAKTFTDEIEEAEDSIIKLFNLADERGGICIKEFCNIHNGSFGPIPSDEESFLYMTWKIDNYHIDPSKLTPTEIEEIIDEASEDESYDELLSDMSRQSIRSILELTRRWSHVVPLRWHRNHKPF